MKYLNIKEAANRLNVSLGIAYELIRKGKLKAYRIGGQLFTTQLEIEEYLKRPKEKVVVFRRIIPEKKTKQIPKVITKTVKYRRLKKLDGTYFS